MPVDEIDRQIDQMLRQDSGAPSPDPSEDEWHPPKPAFTSAEHERIAEAFFGARRGGADGRRGLSRRIQVINDLVALCKLEEPSLRAKMC